MNREIKLIIWCLVVIALYGCGTSPMNPDQTDYKIILIDSCEYIEVSKYIGSNIGYYSLTHKGNCKNINHK